MRTVRRACLASVLLVLPAVLAGCGAEVATSSGDEPKPSTQESAAPAPKGLTCPTGARVATEGGSLAEWPEGEDTPEEVVAAESTAEEPWVLVGKKAYVLRPDGTAFEVHDLVKGPKGWFAHGYEACADGP